MELEPIDLGLCRGCFWKGDPERVVIGLPGAVATSAPALIFSIQSIVQQGWSAIQVIDEYLDRERDPTEWVVERATAALARAGEASQILVVAKSLSTRAAGLVASNAYPAVWLTPLLTDDESVAGLRRRTAPALLIGGTDDELWDGDIARALSDDVLELDGVNHSFGRRGGDPLDTLDTLKQVVTAVGAFAARQ